MTEPIEGIDYFVRIVPFPVHGCFGAVMSNLDGTYNIYINANASAEMKYAALQHEIEHIRRGDLFSDKKIDEIERIG